MRHSLVWPTSFLEKTFRNDYRRISHPKSSSSNNSLVERDALHHWAERVHSELLAL
ncbi:Tn7-like element transposition protein TnsE [Chlorobaculum parvum]|uniref:Tn7-like element transposition protein TnsE n=1 Tax=Chlorobaculum parvum TaxID=274539 RepID=UPI0038CC0900